MYIRLLNANLPFSATVNRVIDVPFASKGKKEYPIQHSNEVSHGVPALGRTAQANTVLIGSSPPQTVFPPRPIFSGWYRENGISPPGGERWGERFQQKKDPLSGRETPSSTVHAVPRLFGPQLRLPCTFLWPVSDWKDGRSLTKGLARSGHRATPRVLIPYQKIPTMTLAPHLCAFFCSGCMDRCTL